MFLRRLPFPPPPLFCRQCLRLPPPVLRSPPPLRAVSSLSSRILPPSLHRPPKEDKKVKKTQPLPLSPSPRRLGKRARYIVYLAAFAISAGTTYTVLRPDNIVSHAWHGVVRCSRVSVALVKCVFDYRMAIKRGHTLDEETATREMSECHLRCAKRALGVFEKNGGIYIKLGQHLAALSYLIPIVPNPAFPDSSPSSVVIAISRY